MGYYTRVLTTKAGCIPVSELQAALSDAGHHGSIEVEAGDLPDWTQLVLRHANGLEIAAIERNPVAKGSLGAEEIEEFRSEVLDAKPQSAVEWLQKFFPKVKCVYAIQHLSGAESGAGFEMLSAVRNAVWSSAPAILQADGEGFSNEAGYHILWQFDGSVSGSRWMGLLQDGKWVHFQMDLGNKRQRDAFRKGLIPRGVRYAD
jgi:hypothetical protein